MTDYLLKQPAHIGFLEFVFPGTVPGPLWGSISMDIGPGGGSILCFPLTGRGFVLPLQQRRPGSSVRGEYFGRKNQMAAF